LSLLLSTATAVAADPIPPPPTEVVTVDHTTVDRAFALGQPMIVNSSFRVQAGRRVMPGEVELHEHDTDIFYVLEGTATFVTGGKISEGKTTGPGETRGKAIIGGEPRHLVKGDVIVIPAGVPHWFTEVGGTFLYFVVKVTR
jgi:quercetin dioxygenase-like cupin family protein